VRPKGQGNKWGAKTHPSLGGILRVRRGEEVLKTRKITEIDNL